MSGRLFVILSLVFGLVFLGLATLNGEIIALALPLLAYLTAAAWLAPRSIDLEISRHLSMDRVMFNKPVDVELNIHNRGSRLDAVQLEDRVYPALLVIKGAYQELTRLEVGANLQLAYQARGQRGKYRFEGLQVVASDRFGLFQTKRFFPAAGQVLVFPKVERLRPVKIRPVRTHGFAGPLPANRAGSGVDFFGVRSYQIGDALRHINWRISARREQELYTNEFEQEGIADVGLILDAREQTNIRTDRSALFEYSLQAAASLADVFLREGHRVGCLIYGFGLVRVFPGFGQVQRERIFQALTQAQPGKNYVLENLNRLPVRFFPPKSQIVLVSPLALEDVTALSRLRAQGYSLLVVSPNPVEFEYQVMPAGPERAYAYRLAKLERGLLLRQIRRSGIQLVDWRIDLPLDGNLHAALAHQPLVRKNWRLIS